MNIDKLKYYEELLKTKEMLMKNHDIIDLEIKGIKDECDHIKICVGNEDYLLDTDSSINYCLLCGRYEPNTKYPIIYAQEYKKIWNWKICIG